jgi:hypothetical protein
MEKSHFRWTTFRGAGQRTTFYAQKNSKVIRNQLSSPLQAAASSDHPNILNWVASGCSLVLILELNGLEVLGNFNIRLGGVNARPGISMSLARWCGSIPPNRREILNRERLPQTRQ